jgi:hypothetical protein
MTIKIDNKCINNKYPNKKRIGCELSRLSYNKLGKNKRKNNTKNKYATCSISIDINNKKSKIKGNCKNTKKIKKSMKCKFSTKLYSDMHNKNKYKKKRLPYLNCSLSTKKTKKKNKKKTKRR